LGIKEKKVYMKMCKLMQISPEEIELLWRASCKLNLKRNCYSGGNADLETSGFELIYGLRDFNYKI
jgi:hypothetical protein